MHQDSTQSGSTARMPTPAHEAAAARSSDAARLRQMRRALRVAGAAAMASLLFGLAFAPRLIAPSALLLAGSCLVLIVIDVGQTRAQVAAAAVRTGLASSDAARQAGVRTTVRLVLAIAIAAFAAASMALDRTMLVAGSAFVLAAIAIFGAPAWLATVGDNEAMTREDVEARRGNRS